MATKEEIKQIFYNTMGAQKAEKMLTEHARRERENDDVLKISDFDNNLWEICIIRAYSELDPEAKHIEFNMLHAPENIRELAEKYYMNLH